MRRLPAMVVLGLGGAWMTNACTSSEPIQTGALGPGVDPPDPTAEAPLAIKGTFPLGKQGELGPSVHVPSLSELAKCSDVERDQPCERYHLPLLGNPSTNAAQRNAYKTAFGNACYMSEGPNPTFNCLYRKKDVEGTATKEGQGCTDAKMIADVYGAASYDKQYKCLPIPGTKDYWLQVGPDPAIKIDIKYNDNPPLETSLIDVDGVPTAINGPYRNLPEAPIVKVGGSFHCASGQVDAKGNSISQWNLILQVNRDAHGGKIRSDLAFFTWPCNEPDKPICTEDEFLKDPKNTSQYDPDVAQVHHEVRRRDLRGCFWGTNSNKNAAVISRKLNIYLLNTYPSKVEVEQINKVPPHTP